MVEGASGAEDASVDADSEDGGGGVKGARSIGRT